MLIGMEAFSIVFPLTSPPEYKRKEATLNQELVDLEQRLPELARVMSALDNQNIMFKDVGNRMDHLGTIWGTVGKNSHDSLHFLSGCSLL